MKRFLKRKTGFQAVRAALLGLGVLVASLAGATLLAADAQAEWRIISKSHAAVVPAARVAPPQAAMPAPCPKRAGLATRLEVEGGDLQVDPRNRRMLALLAIGLLHGAGR